MQIGVVKEIKQAERGWRLRRPRARVVALGHDGSWSPERERLAIPDDA